MEKIINFLDQFFEAEQKILSTYLKPDLDDYNNAVDSIAQFVIDKLENSFGAKMDSLQEDSFYEEVKDFPMQEKRLLFRIDKFETLNEEELYLCYTSNTNPGGRKSYFNNFIIKTINDRIKIQAKFNFSDRGTGVKKWHFTGGDDRYMKKVEGKFLLSEESLGSKIEINKILEPSSNEDSMKEYNKE